MYSEDLTLFDRPAQRGDHLPVDLMDLPVAEHFSALPPASGRHLGDISGRSFWVVRGKGGAWCFIATSGSGDSFDSAGTCADRSQLSKGGIWFAETSGNGKKTVSVLFADDIREVGAAGRPPVKVVNNLGMVEIPESEKSSITLTDHSGSQVELDLGNLVQPE